MPSPPPDLFEQTLVTASFAGVEFPVLAPMPTTGGNTLIRHRAYRRRGVDVEPTQQKEYEGTLTAALLNDLRGYPATLFPDRYYDLIRAFEDNKIATLWHPSKGQMTVAIESWEEEWDADVRNGLKIQFKWVEHNASAGLLLSSNSQTPQNSPALANQQAANADAQVASLSTTSGYVQMGAVVGTMLTSLAVPNITPNAALGAISPVVSQLAANLALPSLANVASHTAIQALEDLRVTVLAIQSKVLTNQLTTQQFTVPQDMAVWQIAQLATGDVGNANLIEQFNTIPNGNLVRAGTVLTVPIISVTS